MLLVVLAAFAVAASPVLADDPAGQINRVRGTPELERDGARQPASTGQEVLVGDLLITDGQSRLELMMTDQSTIIIGPLSQVRVAAFSVLPEGARERSVLEVVSGILRAIVTPGGDFDVRARAAVVSVRATELAVEAAADGVAVLVLSGTVEVAGAAIGEAPITLTPGEGIDLVEEAGDPPDGDDAPAAPAIPAPRSWGAARIADTLQRTTLP